MGKSLSYKFFSPFLRRLPDKARVIVLYYRRFRELPNLKNPSTFNEKVQVKKLVSRSSDITVTVDKLAVKRYVKERVPFVKVPETLWVASSKDEIRSFDDFDMPDRYVVKTNYGSQDVIVMTGKTSLSSNDLLKIYGKGFGRDKKNVFCEWGYENVPRKVFAESFIGDGGRPPSDYKFFVYHGVVHYIQVDSDRFGFHRRNMFNEKWEDLGIEYSHPRKDPSPMPPVNLDKMIEVAQTLGKDFDFVRVDLYSIDGDVFFGEMTHYPGSGLEKFPEKRWDIEFSHPWKLF